MQNNFFDRMKLPFQKDRELRLSLYRILGFYPHRLSLYKLALMHKSVMHRNKKGKAVNNERLEFLGDAILSAIVGDIVYEHFPGKREGFLTNTRSKLVQREMLNRLSVEMGISRLVLSSGRSSSHNSYVGGNAFEALVGAVYLDRGYEACMRFIKKRILSKLVNIDVVAKKEVNFKSRLLEWSQKNHVEIDYRMLESKLDDDGSPMFEFQVVIEGIDCEKGTGYSKKESQQKASQLTLEKIRHNKSLSDAIFAAKAKRTESEQPAVEVKESVKAEVAVEQPADKPQVEEQPKAEKPKRTQRRTAKKAASDVEKPAETLTDVQPAEKKPARRRTKKAEEKVAEEPVSTEKGAESATEKKPRRRTVRPKKSAAEKAPEPQHEPLADATAQPSTDADFDLSHITHREQSREEIIAAAEEQAFSAQE